jgi:ABC-2 type transport system ATP-binding protein
LQLAIDIQGLCKSYRTKRGRVEALRGLDLTVGAGEIYGFIGVNGAGKSTSIKILLGLVQATEGKIEIFGAPGGTLESRKRVGYLPEVATYHEFCTAEELLMIHASLAQVPRAQRAERCSTALEDVGLSHRRSSRISEFSKGMKQRFGIAQALVADPPLLVLDELTSGLDPFAQRELREVLMRLKSKGITIFFSSHYMAEIETVCDRVGIIHRGKLRAEGTLDDLLHDPGHMTIAVSSPDEHAPLLEKWHFTPSQEGRWSSRLESQSINACLTEVLAAGMQVAGVEREKSSLEDFFHQITLKVDKEEGFQ